MNTNAIPRWILWYAGFLTLLSLSTSLMGYFAPQYIFANLGIDFVQAEPISYFYAARNVGVLVLCLFGLFTRDSKTLLAMFVLRFVVESLDLIATLKFGIGGMNPVVMAVTWLIVFLVPEFWAVVTLYKKEFTK
ncbi:MAG: hypothetical protein KA314_16400 [Chloroflexi bacterium]|nr:hypothetical protein [Chloroflexota bacterium]MBP8057414.1 hypothetical protein [Chloroflexota bacterium]